MAALEDDADNNRIQDRGKAVSDLQKRGEASIVLRAEQMQ